MRVYLAGPMRGYKDFNFPAFMQAAAELRAEGHEVFNPAEKDIKDYGSLETVAKEYEADPEKVKRDVIKKDLVWIIDKAEAVYLLPGWEASKGVAAEVALAKFLDLPVNELQLKQSTLL